MCDAELTPMSLNSSVRSVRSGSSPWPIIILIGVMWVAVAFAFMLNA